MLLVFERVAQRRQISARQLAHTIHRHDNSARPVIQATKASSIRDGLVSLRTRPNWKSTWIVSNRPARAFVDAFSVWQSKCTDHARHGTKRQRQETAIARFEKCIPKSNIDGHQRKDRCSSALAPVLGDQAKYVSQHHPVPDIRHPSISTSEWAVCPRRRKRLRCSRPEPSAA